MNRLLINPGLNYQRTEMYITDDNTSHKYLLSTSQSLRKYIWRNEINFTLKCIQLPVEMTDKCTWVRSVSHSTLRSY